MKMGANGSQLEKEIGSDQFPANEHYFGLVNFGNTCYCNSVLQALYFCKPFREKVLAYKASQKRNKETLLTCLADLFYSIATQKKRVGTLAPKKFIARLRKENAKSNSVVTDVHTGTCAAESKQDKNGKAKTNISNNVEAGSKPEPTWVHEIFQGTLTNETRCLNCEPMRVKRLPQILALHLKRFKYMEQLNRYTKLSYRVVFPLELRLFNTSHDAYNPDRMYDLVAVVIHCGSGPNRGHYISIVKSHGFWLLFDDDIVDKIDASTIEDFYGLTSDIQKNSESGYILFYQSRDYT
ncbi:PREDICTED: ubiquitin carboxyl-terminal hydrolase 46-like [Priapulus caudatus]|uniref:ubiquitinyl hydrolase 1 n=1 Tax=Priapulus caudatus TaxID=37621 RepID=A0ABM1EZA6_PRICU|nr:PREDICTED: ubiquitin carboxyl-terminal hydrolase 46-like [Priapulus caudatus]